MPVFPSRTLARAWAVACGVPVSEADRYVCGVSGAWRSVQGPSKGPNCLFCKRLGRCDREPNFKCGFQPSKWWPEKQAKQKKLF